MHGHWNTLQASQLGRRRLHLIWIVSRIIIGYERTNKQRNTLRFRHDLQFMDSRGSAVALRGVKRSMLTVGRDMTDGRGTHNRNEIDEETNEQKRSYKNVEPRTRSDGDS